MKVSIIDWIVRKLKRCIGIVEDGDTASTAISKGKYVVWKGNMYTADSAISAGTTLSASGGSKNLTSVSEGAANSLLAVTDSLNSKMTNCLKSGSNNINNIICAGYNTGSGNYFDFFVQMSTGGKTVTAASALSSTSIILPTKRITFSSEPTITVIETTPYGVRLEIAYKSTETANISGTIYLIGLVLTCS